MTENDDEPDLCGHPTGNDEPCKNTATEGDSCWIDAHGGSTTLEGRPTKFNDERAREAIEAAENGLSKAGCGRAAGVDKASIRRWVDKNPTFEGRGGEERNFRPAFAHARAEGEQMLSEGGLNDPDMDSQMARFLLSTSFDYVKTEKRELEHSTAGDFWRDDAQDDSDPSEGE